MSAHSYIYVTIFYFLNYLFFPKNFFSFFLKMTLTYHISHEKNFSTALYVPGRSGVKKHVSSAYIMANIKSETLQISFIEMIKRRGPKIEPCGTPHSIGLVSGFTPS